MEICEFCKKQIIIKQIVAVVDLKSKDIEKNLHLSKSVVSRHLAGEYNRPEIDIFIIERLLGVKIKDFAVVNE